MNDGQKAKRRCSKYNGQQAKMRCSMNDKQKAKRRCSMYDGQKAKRRCFMNHEQKAKRSFSAPSTKVAPVPYLMWGVALTPFFCCKAGTVGMVAQCIALKCTKVKGKHTYDSLVQSRHDCPSADLPDLSVCRDQASAHHKVLQVCVSCVCVCVCVCLCVCVRVSCSGALLTEAQTTEAADVQSFMRQALEHC